MKEKGLSEGVISKRIYEIRGQRVMLDGDLATLYGVPTRVLNQAVRRNIERFPVDFMFCVAREEVLLLRSQSVILETRKMGKGQYSATRCCLKTIPPEATANVPRKFS